MLEVYFANMMADVLGEKGVSINQIEALRERINEAHQQIKDRKWNELAFLDLVSQDIEQIKVMAKEIRETSENFLFLGMGGAAMGPRAILNALSQMHNVRNKPRIFIFDNADPIILKNIMNNIDLSKTTINIVSKSGNTSETVAAFMILWEKMSRELGKVEAAKRIILTCSINCTTHQLVKTYGFKTLEIPEKVVGRFSVLSASGLLLSEVAGIDSLELLQGARDILERCTRPELWENPVYLFSALLFIMCTEENRKINVLMPYADGLKSLSEWFCQLWAESLGKLGSGLTPYPSIGTKDQHSQLQLWMEGPEDKVVIFIKIKDYGDCFIIPKTFEEIDYFDYLIGQSMADICIAGQESTEYILTKDSKPNMSILIPTIDAYHIGQLFLFLEIATVVTGFLFGINPFNQPWVETGKTMIREMLEKHGNKEDKDLINELKNRNSCWKI
ncbi:MAG: glucose-6-phosphate isomerase [Nitrospirae bacterium]|nr:glucose-6-phosphate isomerase [Nitrospirota bacterium]